MRLTAILATSILIGVGLLTGCSSSGTSATPSEEPRVAATPTTTPPIPDISITNFTYVVRGPVKPGQQLIVVNDDEASHSLATDSGDVFDIRVSGGGGVESMTAPTAPGTYDFHCKYHAGMHGMLTVQ